MPLATKRLEEVVDYLLEVAGQRPAIQFFSDINHTVNNLLTFPEMGKVEALIGNDKYTYRSILAQKHYKVIYSIQGSVIFIFTIWDCRRDPRQMKEENLSE